jgi:tripartite-type tricarboxylate transporter receptor subunit TctC
MWAAVFAPAKTPRTIVERMSDAIHRAVDDPVVQRRFEELGVDAIGSSTVELDAFVKEQRAFNKDIIKKASISVGE